MSMARFVDIVLGVWFGYQASKADERWRNQPQPTPPPKPPVPIEQQPSGPVIQPKPKDPVYPTEEQIIAFAKTDPDLQSLVNRYSHTISNRHISPLDSMFNPQGQKFMQELGSLVKNKFRV